MDLMSRNAPAAAVTLHSLVRRFWRNTSLTWLLVVVEGLTLLLMPMVIGWAVDGLMHSSGVGLWQLGWLCVILLIVGGARRLYDTRAYARIYETVVNEIVSREQARRSSVSVISARTGLFEEFVQFLEDSIPGIIHEVIGVSGTLLIIFILDPRVFIACLAAIVATIVIYTLTQKHIYRYNYEENDEAERHVAVLTAADKDQTRRHFSYLMKWQIKLSDLETMNFSLVWIVLAVVLLFSVWTVSTASASSIGQKVSLVMYVFGFIEGLLAFPLYYQQLVRLREIATRLEQPNPE